MIARLIRWVNDIVGRIIHGRIAFVTVITDCRDANAAGRVKARLASLFPFCSVDILGVGSDIEASGNLIDILDATRGRRGIITVNVAPRGDTKRENGSPFCYFFYGKTLVIAVFDGYALSLVRQLGIAQTVHLLDVPTVLDALIAAGRITEAEAGHIQDSQFRGFEFVPLVASCLAEGVTIPSEEVALGNTVPDLPAGVIWWRDCFQNGKWNHLGTNVHLHPSMMVKTIRGTFPCYRRLKDVPRGVTAIVIQGSSGFGAVRFPEIVIQGGKACKKLRLRTGTRLLVEATAKPTDSRRQPATVAK